MTAAETTSTADTAAREELLRVKQLRKYFPITAGVLRRRVGQVHAVEDVTMTIRNGETLGLVGESGCGKSTTGRLLLRLIEPTSGEVWFGERNILECDAEEMRKLRREMQIIFQDPFSSLHPRMRVRQLIAEPMVFHGLKSSKAEVSAEVDRLMETVGLPPGHRDRYPHEFSGGQRQRIGIARGLAVNPKFVVCDEPLSALDVSIQAQVLNLLSNLQEEFGLTYLFIAHDLSVVRYTSDRVAVMYLGRIVEMGETNDLFENPQHPYTEALLSAIPIPDPTIEREQITVRGEIPSAASPPPGCHFHPRCPYVEDVCRTDVPELRVVRDAAGKKQYAACHFAEELSLLGVGQAAPPTR